MEIARFHCILSTAVYQLNTRVEQITRQIEKIRQMKYVGGINMSTCDLRGKTPPPTDLQHFSCNISPWFNRRMGQGVIAETHNA